MANDTVPTVASLMAQHAVLANQHGYDSPEAKAFRERHSGNADFVSRLRICRERSMLINERSG